MNSFGTDVPERDVRRSRAKRASPSTAKSYTSLSTNREVLQMEEDFPEEEYDYRLKPEMRCFGAVVVHIASGRLPSAIPLCFNELSAEASEDAILDPVRRVGEKPLFSQMRGKHMAEELRIASEHCQGALPKPRPPVHAHQDSGHELGKTQNVRMSGFIDCKIIRVECFRKQQRLAEGQSHSSAVTASAEPDAPPRYRRSPGDFFALS
jgi:hypothetical protein